jgi:hypothetical protein
MVGSQIMYKPPVQRLWSHQFDAPTTYFSEIPFFGHEFHEKIGFPKKKSSLLTIV